MQLSAAASPDFLRLSSACFLINCVPSLRLTSMPIRHLSEKKARLILRYGFHHHSTPTGWQWLVPLRLAMLYLHLQLCNGRL